VYAYLGVPRSINTVGTCTAVAGSDPQGFVWGKIKEASRGFVDMSVLLEKSCEFVARLLGTEGVFSTSGGAAALAMSAAACMVGMAPRRLGSLLLAAPSSKRGVPG
jgi:L-seryl-tRNA(Ser) seleniumtransferase